MASKKVAEFASRTAIGPFGSRMKSDAYTESGVPVIRGTNLTGGKVLSGDWVYVSEKTADDLSNCCVFPGDLVFPHRGAIGEVGLVPDQYPRYVMSSSLMTLSCDRAQADPNYVYYFFKSSGGRHELLKNSSQVGTPGIGQPLSTLRAIEVPLPAPDVQCAIAKVLGDLDAKIDVNRRINQTLEAMAQAIFKSWFVDFDPVKAKIAAKAEGRDPLRAAMTAISGKTDAELDTLPPDQFTPLAASATLFPDELEDSELGKIPKGWQVNKVGQLLELAYGKALKATDRVDGPIPVYGSGGMTGLHNAALVNHGSVIVGRKGTVGALYWEDGPFFPIDTTFYVRPFDAPMTYCFYLLQTLGLDKMNTDAAVPGLNRENVYRLEHVLPSSKALEAFDSTVGFLRSAMRANTASSKSLSVLRDTLLPKLLSGELQVHNTDAEAAA